MWLYSVLFSPGFSADPDLCHRSGNPHWLLCCLIHFFFKFGGGEGLQRNHHGRKSRDKIGGKIRWPVGAMLMDRDVLCTTVILFLNFVCLFVCFLVVSFIAFFLSFFFYLFCDNLPCFGMFRDVPCSGFC